MSMLAATQNYYEMAEQMVPGQVCIFHNVSWEEYEELLDQLPEATWLRVSYDEGTLELMTTSARHEKYAHFIDGMMRLISVTLRINICFFGSATIKKSPQQVGKEPDCCFYVQTAPLLGNRIDLDFAVDPPPDVCVEVDIFHDSISKFPIYAGLGVPEVWRFDGAELTIHLLQNNQYIASPASLALPMLSAETLTRFLTLMRDEGEFEAMLAFEEWLQTQRQ